MQSQGTTVRRNGLGREVLRRTPITRSRLGRLRVSASVTALPKQFTKVNPVGERVFVKVSEMDVKSTGGLVLPSSALKTPTQGEITQVSEGCSLKVGDQVIYSKYAGTDLSVGGVEYVLLKEEDVLGVMTDKDVAKMKPLGDRILVKVSESEKQTSAGVLLTESAVEKPTFGTVVSVGPGKKSEEKQTPPNVSIGSTILYSKYSGVEFEGDDETEYIVIRETDVLAELN